MGLLTYITFLIYAMFFMYTNADIIEPNNVVVVILSQNERYHIAHADYLRQSVNEQASELEKGAPKVVLSHELDIKGSWTIVPLLPYLSDTFADAQWFFFCLENTVIRLNKLLDILGIFSLSEDVWFGHALFDHEPTIIHHFADDKKFMYPHIASGFAMNSKLLKSLSGANLEDADFSIDAAYEFARFVLKNTKVRLTHIYRLCVVSGSECITYPRSLHPCGSLVPPENAYFAVKTCTKYHIDRIPVIKKSWAKHAVNIGYFSDGTDKYLRDAYIVPNTTYGHCAKTYAILQKANSILDENSIDWLIISDDDTMFSVARLLRLLKCYNPKNFTAIGERYGFHIWHSNLGYQYLTGGAGVVLSASLVRQMIQPGVCDCPSANTPDDMYLFGICLSRIGVEPIHSSLFHQARPADYAVPYLASQEPISFHKFWMIEPEAVYEQWFANEDNTLSKSLKHTEL